MSIKETIQNVREDIEGWNEIVKEQSCGKLDTVQMWAEYFIESGLDIACGICEKLRHVKIDLYDKLRPTASIRGEYKRELDKMGKEKLFPMDTITEAKQHLNKDHFNGKNMGQTFDYMMEFEQDCQMSWQKFENELAQNPDSPVCAEFKKVKERQICIRPIESFRAIDGARERLFGKEI